MYNENLKKSTIITNRFAVRISLSCIIVLMSLSLISQEKLSIPRVYFVETQLNLTTPSSNFNRNLDGLYFGGGLTFLFQISPERPSFAGVEYNFTYLEHFLFETEDPQDGFLLDFNTTTSLSTLHFIYRHYLGLQWAKLEPFVEGRFGINALSTVTSVSSPADEEFSEFEFNNFDISPSYGMTFGIHYPLNGHVYLTSKIGYYKSLSSKYHVLDSDKLANESSFDAFSQKSSTIDVIRYDLGVTFAF